MDATNRGYDAIVWESWYKSTVPSIGGLRDRGPQSTLLVYVDDATRRRANISRRMASRSRSTATSTGCSASTTRVLSAASQIVEEGDLAP